MGQTNAATTIHRAVRGYRQDQVFGQQWAASPAETLQGQLQPLSPIGLPGKLQRDTLIVTQHRLQQKVVTTFLAQLDIDLPKAQQTLGEVVIDTTVSHSETADVKGKVGRKTVVSGRRRGWCVQQQGGRIDLESREMPVQQILQPKF